MVYEEGGTSKKLFPAKICIILDCCFLIMSDININIFRFQYVNYLSIF